MVFAVIAFIYKTNQVQLKVSNFVQISDFVINSKSQIFTL